MSAKRGLTSLVAALGLLVLVTQVAGAVPLPGQTGEFGISPARRYLVATPPVQLEPTTVRNTTSSTYDVSIFPAILHQNLSGAFDFSSAPRSLNAAKLALTASPTRFSLTTGATQPVQLGWNLIPSGRNWVAIGVIFQGIPRGQTGQVHVIARLLSVNFFRLPGPVNVDGIFTGLFPEQGSHQTLRFVARVKNTGNDFTAPSGGQLTIKDSAGHQVLSEPWHGIQMLPGATVDYPIIVSQLLQGGRYTATVSMDFGGAPSKTVPFTLVGPNQLPTPAITVQNFNGSATVGSPAQVTARVISSGTAPADVTLHLYLGAQNQAPGQNALAADTVTYQNLGPGSVIKLSRPLGGPLKKGAYQAIVTWRDPTGAHHSLTASFTALQGKSWLQSLWDWIKHHLVLFIGLLIIALFLVLAYLYNKQRQRQRQMEADLAAAQAALKAEPPAEDPRGGGSRRRSWP